MKKILSLALALLLVLTLFSCTGKKNDASGSCCITFVNLDGETVVSDTISWNSENANLFEMMKENYNVDYSESRYGVMINSIASKDDGKSISAGNNVWLALYVDGEMSTVGISDVTLKDGMTISFVETAY